MRMTRTQATEILRQVRELTGIRRGLNIEVGERVAGEGASCNWLLWADDEAELQEMVPLREVDAVDWNGWVALDCYCYENRVLEDWNELITNVYVLIAPDGSLAYLSDDTLGSNEAVRAVLTQHNVPLPPILVRA